MFRQATEGDPGTTRPYGWSSLEDLEVAAADHQAPGPGRLFLDAGAPLWGALPSTARPASPCAAARRRPAALIAAGLALAAAAALIGAQRSRRDVADAATAGRAVRLDAEDDAELSSVLDQLAEEGSGSHRSWAHVGGGRSWESTPDRGVPTAAPLFSEASDTTTQARPASAEEAAASPTPAPRAADASAEAAAAVVAADAAAAAARGAGGTAAATGRADGAREPPATTTSLPETDEAFRARIGKLADKRSQDGQSRLEEGAAAFASHFFDKANAPPATTTTPPESEDSFRSRLRGIAKGEGSSESRLSDGVAAFAGHLWDTGGLTGDTTAPPLTESESDAIDAGIPSAIRLPAGLLGHKSSGVAVKGTDWYRVNINTVVRSGYELNSTQVAVAKAGLFVHVVEKRGRRSRVDLAATTLSDARPVKGWVSSQTADGRIVILRPSRQAAYLANHSMNSSMSLTDKMYQNAHDMRVRKRMEREAVGMAKVTAMQKHLDDQLHKVNVNGMAKDLTHFGRHSDEYAKKGLEGAEQAGQHVAKSFETGATKLLGALNGKVKHVVEPSGKKVGTIQLPTPTKAFGKSILDALKKRFDN